VIKRGIALITRSIVLKLWLTIIAVVILVLLPLSVYLEHFFDTYFYQLEESSLEKRATHIAAIWTSWRNDQLANIVVNQLADEDNATLFFTGTPGKDIRSANIIQQLTVNEKTTLANGDPIARRGASFGLKATGAGIGPGSLTVVAPLYVDKVLAGFVLLFQSQQVVNDPLRQIREYIYFAVVFGVMLTTGLSFVVSKNLSRPLVQMNNVAEQMVLGNFRGKVNVTTHDEVGRLGDTFNKLVMQLDSNIEELSREKEQLSGIISSMADGVVSADLEATVVLANPPGRRWLRTLVLAEQGIADESSLPSDLKKLEEVVTTERTTQLAWMDWQGRHVRVTMTPLYDRQEAIRGVVAVIRDVTEERRLDRLRKDFVANVSHELRTPLSMMQGYSEALLDEFGDDPEQRRELTNIILDETHRMRRLVNDLLDLAQLEAGQFQMNHANVEMPALVRKITRKFSTLANERVIDLVAKVDTPETCPVFGDADRLEQVFTNLVDNALRHTNKHGRVTLRLSEDEQYVRVQVSDTGTGIPEEDLPFIWERFYKVDKARTRSRGGTGLGLSIARNIVLEHQGDIDVESEVGSGTTFTVVFPKIRV